MSEREWKMAEITTQSLGPRYVIELDEDTKVANTVTFNGFRLGLDGRAEVEYTDLEIVDQEYPRGITAKFRDCACATDQ